MGEISGKANAIRRAWVTSACLAIVAAGHLTSAEAQARDESHALDIPAQDLHQALQQLALISHHRLFYRSELVQGKTSGVVKGTLTTQEALLEILAGTHLTFEITPGQVVLVKELEERKPKAAGEPIASNVESSHSNGSSAIRLAQLENASSSDQSTAPPVSASDASAPLSEVVITGSHIRGEAPAGSRVLTITREEIERSGHARVEDLFETLPQNFSGSSSEDSNTGIFLNNNFATGIDLRGLGSGTTLILVNGHRQPPGDLYGSFVDVSSIPSSAIERIEMLTDGASAVYGSDAIGGVVNFVLRQDYSGAETRLRYGSLDGDADDVQISQLLGKTWSGGHALVGYQYFQREGLPYDAIPYLATAGDMRKFGGSDFRVAESNPAVILCPAGRSDCVSGAPAYAIPRGQNGTALTVGDLIPLNGVLPADYPLEWSADRWYLPQEELHTVFLSTAQSVGNAVELFLEGRYALRDMRLDTNGLHRTFNVPSSNPYYINPFGGTAPVRIAYNFRDDVGVTTQLGDIDTHAVTAGVRARLKDWQLTLSGTYGEEKNRWLYLNSVNTTARTTALASSNPATALNVFGSGASNDPDVINALRSSHIVRSSTGLQGGELVADGPLFELMGRDVRLAVGAGYRAEKLRFFQNNDREFPDQTTNDSAGSDRRHVSSAFAELAIPLLGGARRLELSLAGRFEDYSDFGRTTNPKVGLRWQPDPAWQLRGTWGTSFRAPKLVEKANSILSLNIGSLQQARFADPANPSRTQNVLVTYGVNPDLHEETADIWTAGVDFSPESVPGLQVSATHFDIDYSEKISSVLWSTVMQNQAVWAEVITPSSPELVSSLCAAFPGTCTGAPIYAIIDGRLRNLNKVRVRGTDLDVRHAFDTSRGVFSVGVGGTYMSDYDQAVSSNAPSLSVVNTTGNPLSLRLRGYLSWTRKGLGSRVYVNHAGSYDNPSGVPAKMRALTTVDINLSYEVSGAADWLEGTRFSLGVVNAFDELPPFLNTVNGYDTANGDVTGRKMYVQIVKEWM